MHQSQEAWRFFLKRQRLPSQDKFGRLISDPDHSEEEDRFILLGTSIHSRLLIVCRCIKTYGETIRIISARKADKRERKTYEGYRHA